MIQISLGWIDDDDNGDYNDLPWVAQCYPGFPCVTLGYAASHWLPCVSVEYSLLTCLPRVTLGYPVLLSVTICHL